MATIDIQHASDSQQLPSDDNIERWVMAALELTNSTDAELSVRLVNTEESQSLNKDWRGKDKPTNVLSFPAERPIGLPEDIPFTLLGDIVVCSAVVEEEAQHQGKSLDAHWAHMLIHGTLHLKGFDHIEEADASVMEALEIRILGSLNYADPYQNTQD